MAISWRRAEPAPIRARGVPLPDLRSDLLRRAHRHRADRAGALTDLELAERAALAAGELLLARYERPAEGLDSKSSATDMVSDADREAEEAISRLLRAERPDDGLLGEEGLEAGGSSGRRWVVDPLDGTTNYLYRYPAWCVSVALEDADGGLVGVVHDPLAGETFRAVRGEGACLNGAPTRVRDSGSLERALVATGFGYDPDVRRGQGEVLLRLLPRVRDVRRAGAAALDLCHVAAGRLDGYYERGINPWDWAAGALIVQEAGGRVLPLEGGRPGIAAASGPTLAEELVELTRE
jgi:myo-inositol-1(or 4)-monophosphatase